METIYKMYRTYAKLRSKRNTNKKFFETEFGKECLKKSRKIAIRESRKAQKGGVYGAKH